jgi:CheY-like chemotaxis protein
MPTQSLRPDRRLLLIDDNVDALDLMQMLLSALGFSVKTATNGKDGLAKAREFLPQVVFLDLGMPGMSGYDVAAELRKIPALQNVFMLALTGWSDAATRTAVVAAGFDRHLVKPPRYEVILDILNAHFDVLGQTY